MRIFLIGMPGSGKSYWMEQLSRHWRYAGVDLDAHIESTAQRSIPELFAASETYFREKERQALLDVIETFPEDIVIATGGGVPFFYDNMERMKQYGKVIYLEAEPEQLFKRLKQEETRRPLLQSGTETEMRRKLETLYMQRKDLYEQAHHIVDAANATLATFAALLHP